MLFSDCTEVKICCHTEVGRGVHGFASVMFSNPIVPLKEAADLRERMVAYLILPTWLFTLEAVEGGDDLLSRGDGRSRMHKVPSAVGRRLRLSSSSNASTHLRELPHDYALDPCVLAIRRTAKATTSSAVSDEA
jgi:hypothetical protein